MLNGVGDSLERYMTLLVARQKVVASNIANVDTPGYKTKDIDFHAEFRNAMNSSPNPVEIFGLQTKSDGNNVSLDREARMLAENALRFNLASKMMRSQIRLLKSAIEGGNNA
ncbi:MAG: flagellar basal body protein [Bryobacteraceae bacterium]